jgi:flavin reductase (DIM6/NTAB) family NADH-FMN oxidoreductase RutF
MKKSLGARNCLYPMPVTIVGATVGGKPNFITVAHVGIMSPGCVSLGMHKSHHTNAGIRENGTFSINLPAENLVKETDYCGLVSGKGVDKSTLFKLFYGSLKTAPMIDECPVNMECRLLKTVDFTSHDIFIGEVVAAYCDEKAMNGGEPDITKVKPILFSMRPPSYWKLGERFADAWSCGKSLR